MALKSGKQVWEFVRQVGSYTKYVVLHPHNNLLKIHKTAINLVTTNNSSDKLCHTGVFQNSAVSCDTHIDG